MKKQMLAITITGLLALLLTACSDAEAENTQATPTNGNAPIVSINEIPNYAPATDNQGGNAPTSTYSSANSTATQPTETDVFFFTGNGNTILLDTEIDAVLNEMGEPISTFDRPSCAFDGVDRFFLFPGLQIMTYPINGTDRVHTIMLMDDSLTTVNGIFLGASLDALLAAYGHDYDYSYGMYIFTRGNTTIRFNVNDYRVQTISYELLV